MARILFGANRRNDHNDLVARLQKKHQVTYIQDSQDMYWECCRSYFSKRYDLVLYDSGLFLNENDKGREIEIFEVFTSHDLHKTKAQVIVLAEKEVDSILRLIVKKHGFTQIRQPYKANYVMRKVNSLLRQN